MAYPDTLTADDFTLSTSTPGEKSVVGTYQVDDDRVLMCDLRKPLLLSLVTKQTVSVSASSTETKTLDPEAPRVPYMPDPTVGEYTEHAFIAAYFDSSGDGNKDTLVTGSTNVSYDSFSGDSDFVRKVGLTNSTSSAVDVDIYTIVRGGYGRIRRRDKGTSTVSDQLIKEDSVRWAFTNPDMPEGNREINWPPDTSGLSGVIGPKQYVDIQYYDDNDAVAVPGGGTNNNDSPTNMRINLPFQKREVRENGDPAALREQVRKDMASDD